MKKPANGRLLIVQLLSNELEKQKFLFRPGEKRQPLLFPSVIRRIEYSQENISFFCDLLINTNKRPKDLQNCIKNIDKMIQNHFDFLDKYKKIYPIKMRDYLHSLTRSGDLSELDDLKNWFFVQDFEKVKAKFKIENSETKNNKNDSKDDSKDEVSQLREEVKNLKSFMNMLLLQRKGGVE